MISKGQRDLFRQSVIAQHDDCDYSESGWVAVVIGNWAALTKYGHCSCYDTWASITGGGISDEEGPDNPRWDWVGTPQELLELAENNEDPGIKGRTASPEDYDYDHLQEVYKQIIEWSNKQQTQFIKKVNVKDLVKDNKKVKFLQFREGEFLYQTDCGFTFPVPLSDIGNATMLSEDKAILFMRYIRKHLTILEKPVK